MTERPITGHVTFEPIYVLVCSLTDVPSGGQSQLPTLEAFSFQNVFKSTNDPMPCIWDTLSLMTFDYVAFLFPVLPPSHTHTCTDKHRKKTHMD